MSSADFQIIHTYSRKQAVDDGVLIDVSDMAQEAGIRYPVAITANLFTTFIEPAPALTSLGQSTEGRLWDVLSMFRFAAKVHSGSLLHFKVSFVTGAAASGGIVHRTVSLKALCHPGDDMEPVITIMLPEED